MYVIPPNREMSLLRGSLQLSLPAKPRGHNMPINTFFYSIARNYNEAAMGIILSGTGTDGSLGLKAIIEAGGTSLVNPAEMEADVGRSLKDIKSSLVGSDLTQEAQAVLDTLESHESEVRTEEGGIYLARIQPYRT